MKSYLNLQKKLNEIQNRYLLDTKKYLFKTSYSALETEKILKNQEDNSFITIMRVYDYR